MRLLKLKEGFLSLETFFRAIHKNLVKVKYKLDWLNGPKNPRWHTKCLPGFLKLWFSITQICIIYNFDCICFVPFHRKTIYCLHFHFFFLGFNSNLFLHGLIICRCNYYFHLIAIFYLKFIDLLLWYFIFL